VKKHLPFAVYMNFVKKGVGNEVELAAAYLMCLLK